MQARLLHLSCIGRVCRSIKPVGVSRSSSCLSWDGDRTALRRECESDLLDLFVESKARYAQSTQGRFQRWLHNPRIKVARLYSPLIQATLAGWQDEVLYLSLDTSCLWNQDCIIRISVVYRGRAVPVGWRVIAHNSSSVA